MKNSKNYDNAKFIYGFLSPGKTFSIKREMLFSELSLHSIRLILKVKFPEANKYIKTKEVVYAIKTLIKEGTIHEKGNNCFIDANINIKKSTENSEILTQYLSDLIPVNPENNNTWNCFSDLAELFTEYIKTVQYSEKQYKQQMLIVKRFIEYFIFSGQYTNGLNTIKQVKHIVSKIPENLAQKATIIGYKAEIYRMAGKNGRAEKLLRPTIKQLEKQAKENQLLLAQLYSVLGLVLLYDDKLRFSEAEDYLRRALLIREINLGEEHILTVTSQLFLAEYFNQLCIGNKAFECVEKIEKSQSLYINNYYFAWVSDVKGLASYFCNNVNDAIQYCENGLIARRRFLRKEHPLLLESLHNVGYLLFLSNKPGEAIEYLNKTYYNFKKVYTPEHQNYTITVGVYAMCNQLLNEIDKAGEILLNEVNTILTYPRENYKLYAIAFEHLLEHFHRENDLNKEETFIVEYIKILQSRSRRYDRKYMNILNRYFQILKARGKFKDVSWVKKELSEFLHIELQHKIKTKTITADFLNICGIRFKNEFNDYKRAEEYYIKALEINPNRANYYNNYALLLTSIKKEDDKAEQYYLKSLNLDPKDEVAIGNYAFFLQNARSKFEEAELCYLEALQLDSNERSILANFASLKLILGDLDEAKKLASKALKLCIPLPNRFMARALFCLIVVRMFECKYFDDLLGNMKYLFNYGMEHVTWDNRELIAFTKKILNNVEYNFVRIIFNTINDYSCMEELEKFKYWQNIEPLPFVNAYKSPID